jgi:voltage-gated potassium channel
LVMIPDVVELLSLMTTRNNSDFKVAEIMATRAATLGNLNLWKQCGCTLLGIKNQNNYTLNPSPDYFLNIGERLIIMGSEQQIENAKELV